MTAKKMTMRQKRIQRDFEETGVSRYKPVKGIVAKLGDQKYYPIDIKFVYYEKVPGYSVSLNAYIKIKPGKNGKQHKVCLKGVDRLERTEGSIWSGYIYIDGKLFSDQLAQGHIIISDPIKIFSSSIEGLRFVRLQYYPTLAFDDDALQKMRRDGWNVS